ncbi:hypothetical protein B6U90_06920, partial [Thermoplasmatales archaeon ex4484_6]
MIAGIVLMMTLVGFLPVITNADEGTPARGPPLKTGSILADEVWNADVRVRNATIVDGVTVTVQAGVTIYMEPGTSMYIDGNMTFAGTAQNRIEVRCSFSFGEWHTIQINSTGKVDMQNVTIKDTDDGNTPLIHYGQGSVFKNIELEAGWQGLYLAGKGGDHVSNVKVYDAFYFCVVIIGNTDPIYIRNITTLNSGSGAFGFQFSAGAVIDDVTSFNH